MQAENSNYRRSVIISLFAAVTVVIAGMADAAAPTKGRAAKNHKMFMAEWPEYDDPAIKAYVTEIGNRILAQSPHAGRDYEFIVRDNPTPNAFVAGYDVVYVERGLLTILNSEAELAAVIAHEIGHNVGQHSKEKRARNTRSLILANVASILVGNSGVGQAIMTQSMVNSFKYSRQAELEADKFGSSYLFGAKYDPTQLVGALSQLSDFSTYFAKVNDQDLPHHGLGSSHPRTDRRLREVIEQAGTLPPGEEFIGREEYRAAISGLVYGPNYRNVAPEGYKRYSNEKLGITFLYPDTWSFNLKGPEIVLKDAAKTAQMKISIEKTVDNTLSTKEAIEVKYPEGLVDLQKIHPKAPGDPGTIGARPAQRVALINITRNTYHFSGIAKDNNITAEQDKQFVDMIRSFRRMTPKDRTSDTITEIYFERLKPGESFASMAKKIGNDPVESELELRVLNGYYPKGEAEPGTWIKKLREVKIEDKKKREKDKEKQAG